MRPEFASAVDPLFQGAIELIEKIEAATACDPEFEHAAILGLFDRADIELGASKQWQLARYAVAVWIDEMLLTLPWAGAHWWRNHILEMELFQSRICNVRFFELAREASGLECRDALEVFYNCVILGFRGMYANGELARLENHRPEWPPNVEQWLERTLRMIDVSSRRPYLEGPRRVIEGAPPMQARARIVWWSVAALVLAIINGAAFHYLHWNK